MPTRSDAELRDASPHVYWELRQLLRAAVRVEERCRDGVAVLHEFRDAAALEVFVLHGRALTEFLWFDRTPNPSFPSPRPDDALAVDWFDAGGWTSGAVPRVLRELRSRVGWGTAHVSFKRADPNQGWGWRHVEIADTIASRFADFVADVDEARVADDFNERANDEIIEYRRRVRPGVVLLPLHPPPVGTPPHPSTIAQLARRDDN